MNENTTPVVTTRTLPGLVRFWVGVVSLSGLMGFAGCQTLEEMAPPVAGAGFQIVAERHGVDLSTLEMGRQVYISDCSRCHSPEPIARYSVKRWRAILPRMTRETKLDAERTAAVEAYVVAAHTVLAEELSRAEPAGNASMNGLRRPSDPYRDRQGAAHGQRPDSRLAIPQAGWPTSFRGGGHDEPHANVTLAGSTSPHLQRRWGTCAVGF